MIGLYKAIIFFKSVISINKTYLKNYIFYRKNRDVFKWKKHVQKHIFLLGTPEYGNLGDHLIASGELLLLEDVFGKDNVTEVTENSIRYDWNRLKKMIKKNDLLIMQGGGNISDIWSDQEKLRGKIVKSFRNNFIIIMPQTAFFTSLQNAKKVMKKYQNKSNILICGREKYTYNLFKKIPDIRIKLCPDAAFYLWKSCEKYRYNTERKKIGICFRNDIESIILEKKTDLVCRINALGLETVLFDTVKPIYIAKKDRKLEIDQILNCFSSFELIITDRLHAMIMSYLTGTPCIALANSNGKIEGTYEWIKNAENIYFSKDIEQITSHIKRLLKKRNNTDFLYTDFYKELLKQD